MDILEKLQQIAEAKLGDPLPVVLGDNPNNWVGPLSQIVQEAIDEITKLRAVSGQARPSSFSEVKGDLTNPHLNEERN